MHTSLQVQPDSILQSLHPFFFELSHQSFPALIKSPQVVEQVDRICQALGSDYHTHLAHFLHTGLRYNRLIHFQECILFIYIGIFKNMYQFSQCIFFNQKNSAKYYQIRRISLPLNYFQIQQGFLMCQFYLMSSRYQKQILQYYHNKLTTIINKLEMSHQGRIDIPENQNNTVIDNKSEIPTFIKSSEVWTQKDLDIFRKQYLEIGPSWVQISQKIKNKSANEIKNKFNNAIRRTAKILAKFQRQKINKSKDYVSKQKLLITLQFVNQAQKMIMKLGFTINWQSKVFSFKKQLIQLCLSFYQIKKQRAQCFIELTKFLTYKIRSFSIFKINNLKNWKINEKALNYILAFDKIILEDIDKFILDAQNSKQNIEENPGIKQDIHQLISLPQIPLTTYMYDKSYNNFLSSDTVQSASIFNFRQTDHRFYP